MSPWECLNGIHTVDSLVSIRLWFIGYESRRDGMSIENRSIDRMSPVGTECLYQHIGGVFMRRMTFYKHFVDRSIEDTYVSLERIQSRLSINIPSLRDSRILSKHLCYIHSVPMGLKNVVQIYLL